MNLTQGTIYNGIWNGTIPGASTNSIITYYVNVTNREGLRSYSPSNAPANTYGYIVGALDNEPPLFGVQNPTPSWNDIICIQAWVNSTREISGVDNLTIHYKINQSAVITQIMNYSNYFVYLGSVFLNYTFILSPKPYNTTIQYNITSFDFAGNQLTLGPYLCIVNDSRPPNYLVIEKPINPTPVDSLNFNINLQENSGSGIKNATLYYQINETLIYPHESQHPYQNNSNINWTLTKPNAVKIIVKFDQIQTEPDFDFLIIYDENDTEIFRFNGSYKWDFTSIPLTIVVPGDTVKIQLKSDFMITYWGYRLFECIAVYPTQTFVVGENNPPQIRSISPQIEYTHSSDPVEITISAYDDYLLCINDSILINYTIGTNSFQDFVNCTAENYYNKSLIGRYTIPPTGFSTTVKYQIIVRDIYGNQFISQIYSYIVDDISPSIFLNSYINNLTYPEKLIFEATCFDSFIATGSGVKNVSITYWYLKDYNLESTHPIANNYDYTWTITEKDASKLRVHFQKLDLENNFDYLYIYDKDWNLIQSLTGNLTKYWSDFVDGNIIRLRIITDNISESFGFIIDLIEVHQIKYLNLFEGNDQIGTWKTEIPIEKYNSPLNYYLETYDNVNNYYRYPTSGNISTTIFDVIAPTINSIELNTTSPISNKPISITVNANDFGLGIDNITLLYSSDGGLTWKTIIMNNINSSTYNICIDGLPAGHSLKYYFIIYDKAGNSQKYP
ncbi:MAG: CUB domain-containing protein, partial [Candidatus Helarchaeota archaeon]